MNADAVTPATTHAGRPRPRAALTSPTEMLADREEEARAGAGSSQDLLRRQPRRREDLRHAGGGPGPARRRASTSSSAWWRPTAGPRPRRCSPASRVLPRRELELPRRHPPRVRSRRRPGPPARPSSWSTSWPTPTPRAPATSAAGRMSRSCSPPASRVYTTLNVQHLESLNDVVAQITGIQVRETVPDAVFDGADEVELADLTPDDLLTPPAAGQGLPRRAGRAGPRPVLPQGQPDRPAGAGAPAGGRAGGRPDARLHAWSTASARPGRPASGCWSASAPIPPPRAWSAPAGASPATLRCDWIVLHVETPGRRALTDDRPRRPGRDPAARRRVRRRRTVTVPGRHVAEEVLAYAARPQRHPHPGRQADPRRAGATSLRVPAGPAGSWQRRCGCVRHHR